MSNKLQNILDQAPASVSRLRELAAKGDTHAAELADAIEKFSPSMQRELNQLRNLRKPT